MKFRANGKLLISGEYLVLRGALALAIPTSFGSELTVSASSEDNIYWETWHNGQCIFRALFDRNGKLVETDNHEIAERLSGLFHAIIQEKGISEIIPVSFKSEIDFPMEWGLGSSSSLVVNLAKWSGCDPFALLRRTFGGSGYDVACAMSGAPILYRLREGVPEYTVVDFNPQFADRIHFVYLNRKMNTRESIEHFRSLGQNFSAKEIEEISRITNRLSVSQDFNEFRDLIHSHEGILSRNLKIPPVGKRLFPSGPFTTKSLGAWGGDFIMALGNSSDLDYFRDLGYNTIFSFSEMNYSTH